MTHPPALPTTDENIEWYSVFAEIAPNRSAPSVFFERAEAETGERAGGGYTRLLLTAPSLRQALDRAERYISANAAVLVAFISVAQVDDVDDLPAGVDGGPMDEGFMEALSADSKAQDIIHGAIFLYPEEDHP